MRKLLLIIFLCLSTAFKLKAQTIKVFYEGKESDFIFYADNDAFFTVSVTLEMDLVNLTFSEKDKSLFVIPPQVKHYRIGELTPVKKENGTKFNYRYKFTYGDITLTRYDTTYAYDLPFQRGKVFNLYQGYNGSFSHQHQNAIDFSMPEGTEILAAREGVVVQLIQEHTESCPTEDCAKYNNYITILHSDGTFGEYAHIQQNSARFKPGDRVAKGDVIAYSGNVGWSSGPHLHFACYLPRTGKGQTVETFFRTGNGSKIELLKEGNNYTRKY